MLSATNPKPQLQFTAISLSLNRASVRGEDTMLENHEVVTVEESSTPIKSFPYVGQEAPKESRFCPLAAVNKWPYKFFHHLDSETISKAFFAAGKFRTRGWTL